MHRYLMILLMIFLVLNIQAQTVRNVQATQEGQKIAISYELICTQPTEINLFFSEDNGKTWNALMTGVSGDIGSRIAQGNKVIYWDVLQSNEKLVGNALVFKVKVKEDSKEIKSVRIGNQVWMAENLNVDHYQNGDAIPEVKDADQWSILYSGAWCNYDNNIANGEFYGKLYNWYAVNDARGLCPSGWHVPSEGEWTTLVNYLDGRKVAGGKMKFTSFWNTPNTGANNSSGFKGLPGGYRNANGPFDYIGNYGNWWSSTEEDYYSAWNRVLAFDVSFVLNVNVYKRIGFSVRCVKD